MERITHSFIGALLGALVGLVGWWLYGMAHSLNYDGPAMDPVLRHWLIWGVALHALAGFVLKQGVAAVFSDILDAVFRFEIDQQNSRSASAFTSLVLLAIMFAAIWFTTPGWGAV